MLKMRGSERSAPWPHIYFEYVFEDEVYTQALDLMPKLEQMDTFSGDRKIWPLAGKRGFWGEVREALSDQVLVASLQDRLGVTGDCYPKMAICRDLPGYSLAPHTDADLKVMILLIYLPATMEQQLLGTRLLKKEDDEFTFAKQLGFFPNVGMIFKTTPDSWHDVPTVPEGRTRNTLQVCFFDTPDRGFK